MQLNQQIALLVGAGGAIGQAISEELAGAGVNVIVADVDLEAAEQCAVIARKQNPQTTAMQLDVTAEADVVTGIRSAADSHGGRLDLVINLAAELDRATPVWELPKDVWDRSLEVQLTGTFLVCRETLKIMVPQNRGKIINVSSIAGKMAYPLRASYAVAKAGVNRLTECLAVEAGPHGIQVNAICPGPTSGKRINDVMRSRAAATRRSFAEVEQEYRNKTSLGQFTQPKDISELAVYLASSAGDRITGQCIDVDAGYLLTR